MRRKHLQEELPASSFCCKPERRKNDRSKKYNEGWRLPVFPIAHRPVRAEPARKAVAIRE
jgi:hypothetical protein